MGPADSSPWDIEGSLSSLNTMTALNTVTYRIGSNGGKFLPHAVGPSPVGLPRLPRCPEKQG